MKRAYKRLLCLALYLTVLLSGCGIAETTPSPGTTEDINRGGTGAQAAPAPGDGTGSNGNASTEGDNGNADAASTATPSTP
jgi:uncharacterized protein YceK